MYAIRSYYDFEFLDAMFSRLEDETRQLWDQYGRDILRLCVPPFFASEALVITSYSIHYTKLYEQESRYARTAISMRDHPGTATGR